MDFYQQQRDAKRLSHLLILLYVAGVLALGVVSSLWLSLIVIPLKLLFSTSPAALFSLPQFLFMASLIMLLCLGISYARYQSLQRGGWLVAKALGASRLSANPTTIKEQQFRNVVEEMALASGLPIPALFVQEQELAINSFAAGMGITDAVIVITRGALLALDRDELQAMVAHEFSHIQHGDIRLNMQLAAAMTGLLLIAELAEQLGQHPERESQEAYRKLGTAHAFQPLSSGCHLLGYGGILFSELLKAAVNRQREVLADASAVQFTRNPGALASTLKKVAGHPYASLMFHPASRRFSHLFFAQGLDSTFAGALATHPPLATRIRSLEPNWDGLYIRQFAIMPQAEYRETADVPLPQRHAPDEAGAAASPSPTTATRTTLDLDARQEWLPLIPAPLLAAAHQLPGAQFVLYSLLISTDLRIRHQQLSQLPNPQAVEDLTCHPLSPPLRLGLIELSLSTLQGLAYPQFVDFHEQLQRLIDADGEISLFEWLLSRMIQHQLAPRFTNAQSTGPMLKNIELVSAEIQLLVSGVAHRCTTTPAAAEQFLNALRSRLPRPAIELLPSPDFVQMGQALDRLQQAAPGIKLQLVQAIAHAMEWDGQISDIEFTLFRTLALCLDCPIPPPQPGRAATSSEL